MKYELCYLFRFLNFVFFVFFFLFFCFFVFFNFSLPFDDSGVKSSRAKQKIEICNFRNLKSRFDEWEIIAFII
jgi:hypothetical protein